MPVNRDMPPPTEGSRIHDVDPGREVVRERIEEAERRKPPTPQAPERHPLRRWESER